MQRRNPSEALETHLDAVRAALLAGQYEALATLEAETASLSTALKTVKDPAVLSRIVAKAGRNKNLIEAAVEGLRAAKARLTEIRTSVGCLETYAPDGARRRVGTPKKQLERRA